MNNNKTNANLIFQNLYRVLSSELKCYETVLSLVRNEKEAIVNDNIEELIEITKKQEEIILKIKSLEKKREALIIKLDRQSQINLSYNEFSLNRLAELVDEPYSSQYIKLRKEMKDLLDEIRKINERNLQIIQKSMNTFNTTIELFLSELNPAQTYSRSGKIDKLDSVNDTFLQRLGYASNYEA